MKTRTGKIARLPKPIREQLNQRLENGEPGTSLVPWLNQLPAVQKIIAEQFAGQPIRPQNLSEWRKGGYLEWIRHQLLREQTRSTAEQADDLGLDTTGHSISIAEDIATVMSAELAIHVQTMSAIKNPKHRFRQFCRLSRELSRLRRDDQRAIRNQLRRKQTRSTRELIEQSPEIPVSASPPGAGGASVPASRGEHETAMDDATEMATTPERQRAGALPDAPHHSEASAPCASVPECATTPPLCLSEPKHEDPTLEVKALHHSTPATTPANPPYNPPLPLAPFSPPSAPIRVNPSQNYYDPRPPLRGRRFACIEG